MERQDNVQFQLKSPFAPTGDQPQAIEKLTEGVLDGIRTQVLVGVTGSGKTFTMANVIQNVGRPTLALRSLPSEAAVIPCPSPDTTPPVTNIYFVIAIHLFTFHSYLLLYLTPTPPLPEALR